MIGKMKKNAKFNFTNEEKVLFLWEFNFEDEGPIREIREIFFPQKFSNNKVAQAVEHVL